MSANEPRIVWAEGEPPSDYDRPVLLRMSRKISGSRYHVGVRVGRTWIAAGRFLWDYEDATITHHAYTNEPEGVDGD